MIIDNLVFLPGSAQTPYLSIFDRLCWYVTVRSHFYQPWRIIYSFVARSAANLFIYLCTAISLCSISVRNRSIFDYVVACCVFSGNFHMVFTARKCEPDAHFSQIKTKMLYFRMNCPKSRCWLRRRTNWTPRPNNGKSEWRRATQKSFQWRGKWGRKSRTRFPPSIYHLPIGWKPSKPNDTKEKMVSVSKKAFNPSGLFDKRLYKLNNAMFHPDYYHRLRNENIALDLIGS